tara:strand:- start:19519 stop:20496 length:978 start_codon:yes stop_codon:yes gene_type:complete
MNPYDIFKIDSQKAFTGAALQAFAFQYAHNPVYREFCDLLKVSPQGMKNIEGIPFLPIQFFKEKEILTGKQRANTVFTSSGTTGMTTSKHLVADVNLYEASFTHAFEMFYGPATDYCILALLPAYLERTGSSLIYMVDNLINTSKHPDSGFYLDDLEALSQKLKKLDSKGQKTLLIGVSFALLDLVETYGFNLKNTIVMETGGMKGRRREIIREELHEILCKGFGVSQIHSEYGMTELLSQGYSKGKGIFRSPPWMKIRIRDTEDALSHVPRGKTGGINVIDLANWYSCPFIATQDLGKDLGNGSFEILGRFDTADVRGCNLMVL